MIITEHVHSFVLVFVLYYLVTQHALHLHFVFVDGIMHHAFGMLQSRENLSPVLWPFGAAVLHDQQSPPGKF